MNLDDVQTPALLLDIDILERNIARMAERTVELGVALRPHAKTHKCLQVAQRQLAAGARGLTVSTLEEAKAFASDGCDDLTWALPLPLSRLPEALELARNVRLGLLIDSEAALAALSSSGAAARVWIKVDCGYHRAGVDPRSDLPVRLAAALADSPTLEFAGLLTHGGHAYAARGRRALAAVAEQERSVVAELAERLRRIGVEVPEVSVGSTPGMSAVETLAGVTEARPGNYVFFDAGQVVRGVCWVEDCALTVLATVISSPAGGRHSVVDAGALALSKDQVPDRGGYGWLLDDDGRPTGLQVTSVSQEHGIVDARLPVGERVRILEAHSCLTMACFDEYQVVERGSRIGTWKIHRRR